MIYQIRQHKFIFGCVLAVLLLFAVLLMETLSVSADKTEEEIRSITDAVNQRALECYVIEGAYPESLSYLEENYGLTVNKEDFRIIYTPYAENMPPEVRVISRKGQ